MFLSVTAKDAETYIHEFDCKSVIHLPLFLPEWKVNAITGMGTYCLYHGDLSVDANIIIIEWLVKKIFVDVDIYLKIAGKKPPKSLKKLIQQYKNITLISDPFNSTYSFTNLALVVPESANTVRTTSFLL
ncbi:hypothetical protein HMI54_010288 [Coelomomyces lativittatus]|nr:hypothetical protein HMI54_010288 [Coelomomyces lativittatus]